MNSREKILIAAVAGLIATFGAVVGAKAVFVKPLQDADRQIATVRDRIQSVQQEQRACFAAEDYLKQMAQRAFSDKSDQANARAGELLTAAILKIGLNDADFSRTPSGEHRLKGGVNEVAWTLQGEGPLPKILQLILLLDKSRPLHRIDGLALTPIQKPGQVRARFRYATLVFSPPPDAAFLDVTKALSPTLPDQSRYAAILQRNLLEPYVKPAPPDPAVASSTNPPSPTQAGPENFRVVSLSEWNGQPEIHLRDIAKDQIQKLAPGDPLAGGVIVLVDYRPLPVPGKAGLLSYSRVILKIGSEYWAVERGQTLAEKYRLKPEELPIALSHAEAK